MLTAALHTKAVKSATPAFILGVAEYEPLKDAGSDGFAPQYEGSYCFVPSGDISGAVA